MSRPARAHVMSVYIILYNILLPLVGTPAISITCPTWFEKMFLGFIRLIELSDAKEFVRIYTVTLLLCQRECVRQETLRQTLHKCWTSGWSLTSAALYIPRYLSLVSPCRLSLSLSPARQTTLGSSDKRTECFPVLPDKKINIDKAVIPL